MPTIISRLEHPDKYQLLQMDVIECLRKEEDFIDHCFSLTDWNMFDMDFRYLEALPDLSIWRCTLERCNFSNMQMSGDFFYYDMIVDSTFISANFNKTYFSYSRLSRVNFNNAYMRKVHFNNVAFDEVSFDGADLSGGGFTECDLRNVNLGSATFRDTAFSKCLLNESIENARGIAINATGNINDDGWKNTIFRP